MPDSMPPVQPLAPVTPGKKNRESLIPLPKVVTRISTGERWAVQGGYNWEWIAENVCESEITGKQLYMVATGKAGRAGDWKIEVM